MMVNWWWKLSGSLIYDSVSVSKQDACHSLQLILSKPWQPFGVSLLELLQAYELCQLLGQVFRSLNSSNIANRSSDNPPTAGIHFKFHLQTQPPLVEVQHATSANAHCLVLEFFPSTFQMQEATPAKYLVTFFLLLTMGTQVGAGFYIFQRALRAFAGLTKLY